MEDLAAQTIFVTVAGSHAHGTARAGSDLDLRGALVAPLRRRLSLFERSEQYEGPLEPGLRALVRPRLTVHPTARGLADSVAECVLYDVAKFIGLCAAANPNALEVLFADSAEWLYVTPTWERLYDQRTQFLTRKVQQTYLGYAISQLKRIRTHRSWLLHPPARKPSRADFGLPESSTISGDDRVRLEQAISIERVEPERLQALLERRSEVLRKVEVVDTVAADSAAPPRRSWPTICGRSRLVRSASPPRSFPRSTPSGSIARR